MFNKYYQPSKKVSAAGLIALIALFIAVGSALAWVYLWILRVCEVIILNVFAAIGYGALMGFLGKLIVKKCKLRNPKAVLVAIIIGVLGMTYMKWAIYDYYDWQLTADAYEEYFGSSDFDSDLKDEIKGIKSELQSESERAFTYYEMDYDFIDDYTVEENYNYLQNNAYEAILYDCNNLGVDINDYYSQSQQNSMKNYTLYQWYSYDILLGTTLEECEKNLEDAKEMKAYEYLENHDIDIDAFIAWYYYGITEDTDISDFTPEIPTMMQILTNPADLWNDIKDINEYGRWSISSDSSSSYSEPENVTGAMLWIIWLGELLIIDLFAIVIAYSQAKKIFIESDNDWAEVYDNNKFTFTNMSKIQLKSMLEQSADNIMNLEPVDPVKLINRPFIKLTISHSKDYSESYLNGYAMTYNVKNRNYVSSPAFEGLCITPKHTGMLFTMFGLQVPARVASDPEFMSWSPSGGYAGAAGYAQQGTAQSAPMSSAVGMSSATVTCGSCGEQMPAGKKFCPHCGAPYEKVETTEPAFDKASYEAWRNAGSSGSSNTPSDEMEGISTDNIDLTKL